ncbi:MAG: hypothetical protein FJZ01_24610 [Candidatus Sericytochromatia bacterium]|nr:hypothetical protein [Candidatus Tanganyikabacteria bacterium]
MAGWTLVALSAALIAQPAVPQEQTRTPELPPGWTWGMQIDAGGNRAIVPVAPDELPPSAPRLAEDPVARARSRLDMLRMALESYYATHRPGLSVYPEARSLEELVAILRHERTLPEGWEPGGTVVDFKATGASYRVSVAVAGEVVTILPPHRDNPLAMFWLPPHRP